MQRYLSLLLFIGLVFWSCEEEQDTTPPTVTIKSLPIDYVSEIVSINSSLFDERLFLINLFHQNARYS